MTGPLVDAKAAGRLLGVPASWVAAEARADRIPHVRLGRYVRFDPDTLEAWWRARLRGPVIVAGDNGRAGDVGASRPMAQGNTIHGHEQP